MSKLELGKQIKKRGIIGLVLIFTIIGAIVTLIFDIINAIKILTTDWEDQELNNSKTIWGILSLILLGPIATIIFGNMVINKLGNQTNTTGPAVSTDNKKSDNE